MIIEFSPFPVLAFWRISIMWIAHWRYEPDMPMRIWLFSSAHDSGSFFWRIAGFEVNFVRGPYR